MAGKIIADTLEHSTAGSVTTDNVVNGSAKAWVNLDSTVPEIQQSFNASSLVDESTNGQLSYSFTNSFSYVDHVGAGSVNQNELSAYSRMVVPFNAPSASGITLQQSLSTDGTQEDGKSVQFIHFGDLA